MKVIFTCGGTAGHVNPAMALAGLIRARRPGSEILFVGARRGNERELIGPLKRWRSPASTAP